MQSRVEDLKATGARVIAISPDSVEQNAQLAERLGLEFPVLSDQALEMTDAFRVRHQTSSPSDNVAIPRPATYIFGADGVVLWRNLTDNWRIRPRPDDLLTALRSKAARGADRAPTRESSH